MIRSNIFFLERRLKTMKLTKHQKQTIRKIYSGEIYDIFSYLKYFHLGTTIKFDKQSINDSFNRDPLPKKYYYPSALQCRSSNLLPEKDYFEHLQNNQLDPNQYIPKDLELSYNTGIKQETWNGEKYILNFYEGVYIANSFNDIIEFLTLWQFLESEMLILNVSQDFSAKFLGLFYIKEAITSNIDSSIQSRINDIDCDTFTYDDKYYLNYQYILSHDHCVMCKEYLNKRIYPSSKLGLFIKRHFRTYEEQSQRRALFAAWIAIFISIASIFLPYLKKETSSDSVLYELQKSVTEIITIEKGITQKLNNITEDFDTIIHLLTSNYITKKIRTKPSNSFLLK